MLKMCPQYLCLWTLKSQDIVWCRLSPYSPLKRIDNSNFQVDRGLLWYSYSLHGINRKCHCVDLICIDLAAFVRNWILHSTNLFSAFSTIKLKRCFSFFREQVEPLSTSLNWMSEEYWTPYKWNVSSKVVF